MKTPLKKLTVLFLATILMVGCKQQLQEQGIELQTTTGFYAQQMGGGIQGATLELEGQVKTIAGDSNTFGYKDAVGTESRFGVPGGITTDGTYLYISDQSLHNIRKINISTGETSTLAGSAGVPGSNDGVGENARFNHPWELTTDGAFLYVADRGNHVIRKVDTQSGEVTTIAGQAGVRGIADGLGEEALFNGPIGITTDGQFLYVTDRENHSIRRISLLDYEVTTLAGQPGSYGYMDGNVEASSFAWPVGITTDGKSLFISDQNNNIIREINLTSFVVTTIAGSPGSYGNIDDIGDNAGFADPLGLTSDGEMLYITDSANHTIRKLDLETREVTTLAGTPGEIGAHDDTLEFSTFATPRAITTDGRRLYVLENNNHTIRTIE